MRRPSTRPGQAPRISVRAIPNLWETSPSRGGRRVGEQRAGHAAGLGDRGAPRGSPDGGSARPAARLDGPPSDSRRRSTDARDHTGSRRRRSPRSGRSEPLVDCRGRTSAGRRICVADLTSATAPCDTPHVGIRSRHEGPSVSSGLHHFWHPLPEHRSPNAGLQNSSPATPQRVRFGRISAAVYRLSAQLRRPRRAGARRAGRQHDALSDGASEPADTLWSPA